MRITFLHPDLGIGGAERLVVDAAVGLQNLGHEVKMVTSQYDKSHAFKETEQLDITTVTWFPRMLFGKMWALCAYIRMCLAAIYICIKMPSDVIFCDQVSACIPLFKMFSKAKVVFYCHHPDLLLTTRESTSKLLYRTVLDSIEEYTTGMADVICVNSDYTASVFRETFKSLAGRELAVVYPTLNTAFFDEMEDISLPDIPSSKQFVFVSLNRYEVKKNIKLAMEAFALLKSSLPQDVFSKCFLVIAGGYDKNNYENITYHKQLLKFSEDLELTSQEILFMKSPSDQVKVALLRKATAVLYTPDKEHFGIVPVEAMYLGTPVIAVNSGGPKESIVHGQTGFLVEPQDEKFADCMKQLVESEELRNLMNEKGPERVLNTFAFDKFCNRLQQIL